MSFPDDHARTDAEKPALVMAECGAATTYRQLVDGSVRIGRFLCTRGLRPEDSVAIVIEDHPRLLEIAWEAVLCLASGKAHALAGRCLDVDGDLSDMSRVWPRLKALRLRVSADGGS
jgi:hypothetical protein